MAGLCRRLNDDGFGRAVRVDAAGGQLSRPAGIAVGHTRPRQSGRVRGTGERTPVGRKARTVRGPVWKVSTIGVLTRTGCIGQSRRPRPATTRTPHPTADSTTRTYSGLRLADSSQSAWERATGTGARGQRPRGTRGDPHGHHAAGGKATDGNERERHRERRVYSEAQGTYQPNPCRQIAGNGCPPPPKESPRWLARPGEWTWPRCGGCTPRA